MNEGYYEPETREEWQEAADIAHVCLCLDSARLYGLIAGGPDVNPERCSQLLARAADRGIRPHRDAVDRCLPLILAQGKAGEDDSCEA